MSSLSRATAARRLLRNERRAAGAALALALTLCAPAVVRAQHIVQPWEDLGAGFVTSFTWPSVLFYAGAVASTPPLAWKVDAPVQRYFQTENPLGESFGEITLSAGYVVPLAVPLAVYLTGLGTEHAELATAGSAALQALFVETVIVNALKWLTDRAGAYPDGDPTRKTSGPGGLLHNSNDPLDFDFNPFDLHGALRWPSGHTASHVAVVSSLFAFYPDELWIAFVGYPMVAAVGVGMIEADAHWLSDVVAGFLIGHVIGWQIGRNFRARFERTRVDSPHARNDAPSWLLLPALSHDGAALTLSMTLP